MRLRFWRSGRKRETRKDERRRETKDEGSRKVEMVQVEEEGIRLAANCQVAAVCGALILMFPPNRG